MRQLKQFPLGILLLAFGAFVLTGCQSQSTNARHKVVIAIPPDIPDVPPKEAENKAPEKPNVSADAFQDIRLLDHTSANEELRQLISGFISDKVIDPAQLGPMFRPTEPVTLGLFSQWLQEIMLSPKNNRPDFSLPLLTENQPESPWVELLNYLRMQTSAKKPTGNSVSPQTSNLSPLPIRPQDFQRNISREELCLLYTLLTQQYEAAQNFDPHPAASNNTPDNQASVSLKPDTQLKGFQDANQISPWAKKYVVVAYHRGIMDVLWHIPRPQADFSPFLYPQRLVTRAEALKFLRISFP